MGSSTLESLDDQQPWSVQELQQLGLSCSSLHDDDHNNDPPSSYHLVEEEQQQLQLSSSFPPLDDDPSYNCCWLGLHDSHNEEDHDEQMILAESVIHGLASPVPDPNPNPKPNPSPNDNHDHHHKQQLLQEQEHGDNSWQHLLTTMPPLHNHHNHHRSLQPQSKESSSDAIHNNKIINPLQTHHHQTMSSGITSVDDDTDSLQKQQQQYAHHFLHATDSEPNLPYLLQQQQHHHHQTELPSQQHHHHQTELPSLLLQKPAVPAPPPTSPLSYSSRSKDSNESFSSSSSSQQQQQQLHAQPLLHQQNADLDDCASLKTPISSSEDAASSRKDTSISSPRQRTTGAAKATKKRIRKNKKTPVAVLSANASNFKAMVQKLTGIRPLLSSMHRFGYGPSAIGPHPLQFLHPNNRSFSTIPSESMAPFACSHPMSHSPYDFRSRAPLLHHCFSFPQSRYPAVPPSHLFQSGAEAGYGRNFDLDWAMGAMSRGLNPRMFHPNSGYLQSSASFPPRLWEPSMDDRIFAGNVPEAAAKEGMMDELMGLRTSGSTWMEEIQAMLSDADDVDPMACLGTASNSYVAPELIRQQL